MKHLQYLKHLIFFVLKQCMRVSPSLPLPNANANFTFGQATIHGWAVFYKSQHSMAFVKPKCVVPGRKLLIYYPTNIFPN
jgi:hypothetical protein